MAAFPKIICVGLNYHDHAAEQAAELPAEPLLFGKFPNALAGPGEPIALPPESSHVDAEADVVVVAALGGDEVDRVAGHADVARVEATEVAAFFITPGAAAAAPRAAFFVVADHAAFVVEAAGVIVFNPPKSVECAVDKFLTTAKLAEAGLNVPATIVCEGSDAALTAFEQLGGDVVVKPLFGAEGRGILRVSDPDLAFRATRTLEELRAVFYVQRAVDHGGRDVRVFVIGGRVIGAIEREAPAGDWRTNVTRGGSARPFELPPAWEQLALRAAAVVRADYAGVDLLPSADGGVFVLEVNGIPGWRALRLATGIDVAGGIVEHIERLVRSGRPAAEAAW